MFICVWFQSYDVEKEFMGGFGEYSRENEVAMDYYG